MGFAQARPNYDLANRFHAPLVMTLYRFELNISQCIFGVLNTGILINTTGGFRGVKSLRIDDL